MSDQAGRNALAEIVRTASEAEEIVVVVYSPETNRMWVHTIHPDVPDARAARLLQEARWGVMAVNEPPEAAP